MARSVRARADELPGGHNVKVVYAADGAPTISARIQDLYGMTEVSGSRVTVSPSYSGARTQQSARAGD